MNPSRRTLTTILLVAALLLTGVAASPVAAQNDSGEDDDEGALETIAESVQNAKEMATGFIDRLSYKANSVLGSAGQSQHTASDTVDELEGYEDDHEQALVEYVNANAPEDVDKRHFDAVRLGLEAGGEQRSVYVVSDVQDGEVQSIEMVNQTDRPIDFGLALDEYATRELPSDVEHVHENYVVEDRSPNAIQSYVASKYWNGGFDSEDSHVQIIESDS